MEHSKENIVKLLRAMSKNCMDVASSTPELEKQMICRALGYDVAAMVVNDEQYFNSLCKCFELDESEGTNE